MYINDSRFAYVAGNIVTIVESVIGSNEEGTRLEPLFKLWMRSTINFYILLTDGADRKYQKFQLLARSLLVCQLEGVSV